MARRFFENQVPLLDFTEAARALVDQAVGGSGVVARRDPLDYASSETLDVAWALLQGLGLRETVRRTRVPRNTIKKVVVDLGLACARFQDETLTGLGRMTLRLGSTPALRVKGKPPADGRITEHCARLHVSSHWLPTLARGPALKLRGHAAALSLQLMFHNFCRVKAAGGTTPAMAAEITDHVWDVEEVAGLLRASPGLRMIGR